MQPQDYNNINNNNLINNNMPNTPNTQHFNIYSDTGDSHGNQTQLYDQRSKRGHPEGDKTDPPPPPNRPTVTNHGIHPVTTYVLWMTCPCPQWKLTTASTTPQTSTSKAGLQAEMGP
eukprot:GHVR01116252.1.p2 GENE.GHVR01116252.1~~GHVR01116252.1.p2  ORF type:complete len:117 (+),score=22.02 GHVR01116252.1:37-387(+)